MVLLVAQNSGFPRFDEVARHFKGRLSRFLATGCSEVRGGRRQRVGLSTLAETTGPPRLNVQNVPGMRPDLLILSSRTDPLHQPRRRRRESEFEEEVAEKR